jgi:hypothetical protein
MMLQKVAGETEVLGENPPQCRFVDHKPHMPPGRETGPPRWEASANRLSYGTAKYYDYVLLPPPSPLLLIIVI